MQRTTSVRWGRAVVAALVLVSGCGGGGSPENRPPAVTSSVGHEVELVAGGALTFAVTATDPDGDPVSLALLNPQPGMAVAPILARPSPQTLIVRWRPPRERTFGPDLVFVASDTAGLDPAGAVPYVVHVRYRATQPSGVVHGDVTGDGIPDTVALATLADIGGVADAGAVYVWAGGAGGAGTTAPLATLTIPGGVPMDHLGYRGGADLRLLDVTGDGVLDVVVPAPHADDAMVLDAGAVLVWKGGGGLVGTPAPLATLRLAGANAQSQLGGGLELGDVTGDGIPDVVAAAGLDVGAVPAAGALAVWKGGPALVGAPPPTATLTVPGAASYDRMGRPLLADVSGDGVLDVLGLAPDADVGGVQDAGAVYVWKGGAALLGDLGPEATLTIPGGAPGDRLAEGAGDGEPGVRLADLTGDGIDDVVALAPYADPGGLADAGALLVWEGGAALAGTPAPRAVLTIPGAVGGEFLGAAGLDPGVSFGDVTGDGVLDLVSGSASVAVGAAPFAGGEVLVWSGGPSLVGAAPPWATLTDPHAVLGTLLGKAGDASVQLADVTGDGQLDVLVQAGLAPVAGVAEAGEVLVWTGGPALAGTPTPLATLTDPAAAPMDRLGMPSTGRGLLLGDVSQDGILDLLVLADHTQAGGVPGAGEVFLWSGGATLLGTPPPLARLFVPGAAPNDLLGFGPRQGVQLADVTGDGTADVVGTAYRADVGGVVDTGALYVWPGGGTLVGTPAPGAVLTVPSAAPNDQLGLGTLQGVLLGDVTGDGVLDLVAAAGYADVGGTADVGALHVWAGGATLVGPLAPLASLTVPGAVMADRMGTSSGGQGLLLHDVSGDGVLDLVAAADFADVGGVADTGAIYRWRGGAGLTGSLGPAQSLTVPGASASDRLGR